MSKAYTISELATELNIAKTTCIKHITKRGLTSHVQQINGRPTKTYYFTDDELKKLKEVINANKGVVGTYATQEEVEKWRSEYYNVKHLYELEKNQTKLLTDRETDYINQNKQLNNEIAELNNKVGGLTATIEHVEKSNEIKNKIITILGSCLGIIIIACMLKVLI